MFQKDDKNVYAVDKKNTILILIIIIVSVVLYIVGQVFVTQGIVKDILTSSAALGITIFLSAILSAWIIERPDYNKLLHEIIFKGLLKNQEFLSKIDYNIKKEYYDAINENMFCDGDDLKCEMYQQFVETIMELDDICYNTMSVDVEATISNEKIVKKIIKTFEVSSLKDEKKIDNYLIAKGTFNKSNHYGISDLKVKVDDNSKEVRKIENNTTDDISDENRYDTKVEYRLVDPIAISKCGDGKLIKIRVEYETVVSINDLSYICKCSHPCRNFKFKFSLIEKASENIYKVILHTYGDNEKNVNVSSRNDGHSVGVEFKNWIYNSDGVEVFLEKNNDN